MLSEDSVQADRQVMIIAAARTSEKICFSCYAPKKMTAFTADAHIIYHSAPFVKRDAAFLRLHPDMRIF